MTNPTLPTTIAVASLKGGVGKSITAFMVARHLRSRGYSVLMIDMDPRATLSGWSGVASRHTISDVLGGAINPTASLRSAAQECEHDIHIVTADMRLINTAYGLNARQFERVEALATAIQATGNHWEIILIDCPGAADVLMINGIYAADMVMIPSQPEPASIAAVAETYTLIQKTERAKKAPIDIGHIIVTMAISSTVGHRNGIEQLTKQYGVCAVIPERKGVDADTQLYAAYQPVADYIEVYTPIRFAKVTA